MRLLTALNECFEGRAQLNKAKPEWQGTSQHQNASDLSRWLVHLTRSEVDLISILKSGRIEARSPYGAGKYFTGMQRRHHSVCLTEIPLDQIRRMTSNRPWGIVFDKERLRAKLGAQPVWYVNYPSPEWAAIGAAMEEARASEGAPIWKLTPFIEGVRSLQGQFPNDWRWEREWRVQGDLDFDLADIAMVIAEEEGAPAFLEEVSVGVPWISSDDVVVRWSGGFTGGWEKEVEDMLDRFQEQFVTVDNAGMPWDSEDKAYFPIVEILDTWDAMEEVFGYIVEDLSQAIEQALSGISMLWCRLYDLEYVHE